MAVFREVQINWQDKEYTLVPSNRLIRRIEREVSLWPLIGDIQAGRLRIGDVAFVVSEIMKEAGLKVTEDDISCDLHDGDSLANIKYAVGVITAILPGAPDEKKPEAPKAG